MNLNKFDWFRLLTFRSSLGINELRDAWWHQWWASIRINVYDSQGNHQQLPVWQVEHSLVCWECWIKLTDSEIDYSYEAASSNSPKIAMIFSSMLSNLLLSFLVVPGLPPYQIAQKLFFWRNLLGDSFALPFSPCMHSCLFSGIYMFPAIVVHFLPISLEDLTNIFGHSYFLIISSNINIWHNTNIPLPSNKSLLPCISACFSNHLLSTAQHWACVLVTYRFLSIWI